MPPKTSRGNGKILGLLANGRSNREVGESLVIDVGPSKITSHKKITNWVSVAMKKYPLVARSRSPLVAN
ncbi:hypothetical protein HQO25_14720 [Rhodococcus fascians]|nr:hypothetical protein [Rhodococcus fascians]